MEVYNIGPKNKINLFRALIEFILLYNATTWTINKTLSAKINGAYTKLLRYALNIHWTEFKTNVEVYQNIQPVTTVLLKRRLSFIGHCWRSPQSARQPIPNLIFWEGTGKKRRGGANCSNYRKLLTVDAGLTEETLQCMMLDRSTLRTYVNRLCK